jgi:hypothetical protein
MQARCYNEVVSRLQGIRFKLYAVTQILAPGFRSGRRNLRKPGVGPSRLQARIAGAPEAGIPARENQENRVALTTNETFLSKITKMYAFLFETPQCAVRNRTFA